MNKMWTILCKEYLQIAKKRSFIISTILTPVIMAALFVVPALLSDAARGEKVIHVMDLTDMYSEPLLASLRTDSVAPGGLQVIGMAHLGRNVEQLLTEYQGKILRKEISGLLIIPPNVAEEGRALFYGLNISDITTQRYLEKHLQLAFTRTLLRHAAVQEKVIDSATKTLHLDTFKVKEEGITQSTSQGEMLMSLFMLTLLMSVIMAYGQLIMRGIIEEKNSRIVELLISSTTPKDVFFGKIFGIGLVGLTQVLIWIVLTVAYVLFSPWSMPGQFVAYMTPELALYFLLFFILGYFSFAILFAVVGAAVNTDEEAQHLSAPISFLMFAPFMIGLTMVTQNADNPFVVVASIVPLLSPMLMFMRISMAMPPLWQILLAVCSSLLTIWALIRLGAKIFRVGILMYGKKPSLREILNWISVK